MDPTACLRRILDATSRKDFAEACEDLAAWLDKGGFKPSLVGARYVPGIGTAWSLLSPAPGRFRGWTLVRWDYDGSPARTWKLEA